MSKTISNEKYEKVTKFIVAQVEPRIQKIVTEINKVFAKDGIRAGVELTWYYDEIDAEKKEVKDESKTT